MSGPTNIDDVVEPTGPPEPGKRLNFDSGMSMDVHDVKQGGMGVVYLGEVSGPDGRSFPAVAKSIREPLLLEPGARVAFLHEMSIWAQLSGIPFVQPLLRVERLNGFPYLLTLRVDPDANGVVSLRDLVRQRPGRLPRLKIFEVALAVATAMARAAAVVPELVHGDIKPDNVLLLTGLPHLSDFGIAKALGTGQSRRGLVGTLAYLAPEAFSGPLTVKSDLYAHGCMLYECLSGAPPYGDDRDVDVMRARHEAGDYTRLPRDPGDALGAEIAQLAEECMRRDPGDRPESFGAVAVRLFEFGIEHAPDVVNIVSRYCEAARTGAGDLEALEIFERGRVRTLLEAGDPAAAVRVLENIPEELRSPELWLLAGSAYSLTGNDERALTCFDRCSAATHDKELLTRCASEGGLSLRRLRRYDEAIALYEDLIPRAGNEQLFAVMGNYAGTLLDAGRIDDAAKQARWLTERYRERPQAWLLMGQVLKSSGDLEEALHCFHRSIDRDPNSVLAHVGAAEIYQFEFGDLKRALAHLDAAFATGEHDPLLIARLLSVNMLLDRREDVGGLLALLEQLPAGVGDRITQMAVADVKKLLERFGAGEGQQPSSRWPYRLTRYLLSWLRRLMRYILPWQRAGYTGSAGTGAESRPEGKTARREGMETAPSPGDGIRNQDDPGTSNRPFVLETAFCFEEGSELPMIGCRAYLTSEMFTIDFYDRSGGEDYAASFGSCFPKFSRQIVVQFGNLHLRNSMLGILHCTHCGFVILSNRSEGELLLCRMCDKRGPVVFERSPETSALVALCESRAGLTRKPAGGTPVLLSFWVPPGEKTETVRKLCEDERWQFVNRHTVMPRLATFFGNYFGGRHSGEPSLQMVRKLPAGEELYEGASWSVQRVVLAVHSRVGRYPSNSMILPEEWITVYLEQDRESVLKSMDDEFEKRLEDPENLARLIERVVEDDVARAGDLVAFSRQLTNRDHPRLLAARGVYALRTGDTEAARQSLEEAKRRSPLDLMIRFSLIKLWEALGMDDKAREEADELRAIGFRLESFS